MKDVRDARVAKRFLSVIHARFFLSWAIAKENSDLSAQGIAYELRSKSAPCIKAAGRAQRCDPEVRCRAASRTPTADETSIVAGVKKCR
jgi:hypothetical protein